MCGCVICRYRRGEIKKWKCKLTLRLQLLKYKLLSLVDAVYWRFAHKEPFMASVTADEIYCFLADMDLDKE